jgi:hypothetical protein
MKKVCEVNQAQCKLCLDILTSRYFSKRVVCKCGNLEINGGKFHLKRKVKTPNTFIELSK